LSFSKFNKQKMPSFNILDIFSINLITVICQLPTTAFSSENLKCNPDDAKEYNDYYTGYSINNHRIFHGKTGFGRFFMNISAQAQRIISAPAIINLTLCRLHFTQ